MFFRRLFWYALPSSLVSVQDSIMVHKRISPQEATQYIYTLHIYDHFFWPWFGFNPVARGEVAIRQMVILSIMHYLLKNYKVADKLKTRADRLMSKAILSGIMPKGSDKFELTKKSFDFYAWVFGVDSFYLKLNNLENIF